MSDDHPSINDNSPPAKNGFFSAISRKFLNIVLRYFFQCKIKNRTDLVAFIRDSEQKDLIDHDTRDMLEGVMNIAEQRVRDIMIPRSQMVILKYNQTLDECLDVITESAHSRFPVISEDKDHIEGMLLAKDLLPFILTDSTAFSLNKVLRPAVVVPESKRVDRMLKEFRLQRYHMAIVIDEFGGVSGLVTIEDILELIVGEIEDEYDDDEEDWAVRPLSNDTYAVRALTKIEYFNQIFNTDFSDDEVDTIGGFVMQAFGHLPTRGEVIEIKGYSFKTAMTDSRRIIQVHVKVPPNGLFPTLEN
ncbi:Putative Mg2+ and Co2+ transporter CorC [Candidatus Regiella insecticola LSR1]|uniref:Magnesium and cobalt efflux protein CorC n=1 Tax=Candidatus Regiella insecticola LSR1 TaxID=663321 RepID=E0WQD8_9ENTR|nr:CNNM family magnesium/cobalt transport protein CorC [Candidatus Regiella insecticola]EFL92348.1 Putative Mg2+ and Co2+ transporter CorC [Candidatus Regiella insecticola LSR1]